MNKKGAEVSITFTVIAIITIVVLCLLVLYFVGAFRKEFDPERDVCIQNCSELVNKHFTDRFEDSEITKTIHEKCISIDRWINIGDKFIDEKKCLSWREKTFCELNPNDQERCVCEEYEYCRGIDRWVRVMSWDDDAPKYLNVSCIEWGKIPENTTMEDYDAYEKEYNTKLKTCIKAHEPNECEKGNPNYIWEYKLGNEARFTISLSENTNISNINIDCSNNNCEKVCREKTIYDYDCQILKEAILDSIHYCQSENKWFDKSKKFDSCFFWEDTDYTIKVFKEKGCEF